MEVGRGKEDEGGEGERKMEVGKGRGRFKMLSYLY